MENFKLILREELRFNIGDEIDLTPQYRSMIEEKQNQKLNVSQKQLKDVFNRIYP